MGKRTRIINDPSYLVPLLRTFGSRTHKKIFDALSNKWMTRLEIDEFIGSDSSKSLHILKKAGLLESQWRVPEAGQKPSKEYHSSYSKVQVNFQCSFEDLSDIIMLTFKPYEEVKDAIEELERLVEEGNTSMSNLTRTLNKNPFYICAVARRSERLSVMGQRLKLIEDVEGELRLMIKILQTKSGVTKFQVLIEVAAHQPNVRQKEIAAKIGITPQAVSEYIKELVNDGLIVTEGRVRYRITKEGVEWVLENAAEMKRYARFVMEDIISHVSTWTAITKEDVKEGQQVYLKMENGLLYVSSTEKTGASGTAISDAAAGDDVGVTSLKGLIDLENATITICKVPRVERGGSRKVDLERLKMLVGSKPYIAAIGVEALISLRKLGVSPNVMFGTNESVIEAAYHGLSSLVVSVDEQVSSLLNRLETENLEYELVDLTLE